MPEEEKQIPLINYEVEKLMILNDIREALYRIEADIKVKNAKP